jgi:RNA polymerase sigma factor for flagellar operon FliA
MQNIEDREAIILKYVPLVEKVVRHIGMSNPDYEKGDLVNIGVIGLMDAIDKYDEEKKVPFENYAFIRIKGAIIDEIRRNGPVSRTGMNKLKEYRLAVEALQHKLKRLPTEEEICQELQISAKQLGQVYDTASYLATQSLEKMIFNDEGNGVELGDMLVDKQAISVEEKLLKNEQMEALKDAIGRLKEREQLVLQLYYVEKLPLKEIAYILEVSVPRVSQIHGKMILKLKEEMRRDELD